MLKGGEGKPACINTEVKRVTASCLGANDFLLEKSFILGAKAEIIKWQRVRDSMSTNFSKLVLGSNILDPVGFHICKVGKLLRPARDVAVVDNRSISSVWLSLLLIRIILSLFITALKAWEMSI